MKDEFRQEVSGKTDDELLEIVGSPEEWQPIAVRYATDELNLRNVDQKKIQTAKYLSKKRKRLKRQIKANQGYHICDFIFHPIPNLIEITLSWELKKDGFEKKARQQKIFRIGLGVVVLIFFAIKALNS